jgi:hypothetical protein
MQPPVTCTRRRHHPRPPWSKSSPWGSARSALGLLHFWHPGLQCRLPRDQTATFGPWDVPFTDSQTPGPFPFPWSQHPSTTLMGWRRDCTGSQMPETKQWCLQVPKPLTATVATCNKLPNSNSWLQVLHFASTTHPTLAPACLAHPMPLPAWLGYFTEGLILLVGLLRG